MRICVCDFEFRGNSFRLASMTGAELEAYVKEGTQLSEKKPALTTPEWYLTYICKHISASLNRAGTGVEGYQETTPEKIWGELDRPSIDAIHQKFLEWCGISKTQGEAPAA